MRALVVSILCHGALLGAGLVLYSRVTASREECTLVVHISAAVEAPEFFRTEEEPPSEPARPNEPALPCEEIEVTDEPLWLEEDTRSPDEAPDTELTPRSLSQRLRCSPPRPRRDEPALPMKPATPAPRRVEPTCGPTLFGKTTPPVYPRVARRLGWEGRVVLRVRVTPDGTVRSVEILESSGRQCLDEAAREAALTWRFEPALKRGQPVAAVCLRAIRFRLSG